MKRNLLYGLVAAALVGVCAPANAQSVISQKVGVCDPKAPNNCAKPDASGNLPITGSITANLGGFNAESNLTPFTATTGGVASGSFTAGKTIVVSNVGATNTAYCKLGAASTTSGQPILPGSWFAFTSIAETQVACATSTSTTDINVAVGTGLPTGAGGGGGSGGGGAVTIASGAVASGAYSSGSIASGAYASGSIGSGAVASGAVSSGAYAAGALAAGAFATGSGVDGWDITQGAKADSVCGTATGTCSVVALLKYLNSAVNSSIPAGTALIGKVGIDQTTPGTTNAVSATNFPATVSTGTGAQGSSSPRVTVATDQATNAGAALVRGGVGVVNGGSSYETVAASQTAQVLGPTGAAGDYLSHCVVYPTSTTPGVVTVFDDTSGASANVIAFPGGASSVSNLVPFSLPVGAISVTGAWKVTTGANLVVTCYGKFT